jgi:phosphomethylpyrimidine synthase
MSTQMLDARAGIITPAMKTVARKEQRSEEFIRQKVAEGTVVIPANRHHSNLIPVGIGRELYTKINANIGNSTLTSCPRQEFEKLHTALQYGADTVMDLSTGGDIRQIRSNLLAHSTIPVGTVPIYEMVARYGSSNLSGNHVLQVIKEQAEQGVDYMTIHAGLLRQYVPMAMKRKLGIVSRGGALLADWMTAQNCENPFYEFFDDILEICLEHDVTLSLGDGMRPGCLADASDEAQFAELDTLGELVFRCRKAGVQAMVEGPGHIPLDQIEMNMKREQEICGDAPFYILGPVVTDCAPGFDHMVAAMGGMMGAYYGAAMLCYVTPKEHLGLPNKEDVRTGIISYKIAAHAADLAKGHPAAQIRDNALSKARYDFRWRDQFHLSLDPERALEYFQEGRHTDGEYCTMCGPHFCAMKLSKDIRNV